MKTKRILAVILTLCMVLAFGVGAASAEELETEPTDYTEETDSTLPYVTESGTCGDNLTWELYSDYKLVISGEGAMYDYEFAYDEYPHAPWRNRYFTAVEIQAGVTSIGESAFYGCSKMVDISIPDTVTSIGTFAFAHCDELRQIELPASLVDLSSLAFYDCLNLTDFYISDLSGWINNELGYAIYYAFNDTRYSDRTDGAYNLYLNG